MSDTDSMSSDDSGPIVSHSRGKVKCDTCNVLISDAEYNIKQHLDGYQHRNKTCQKLMSENGIFHDDGQSYCKPCREYFPYNTDDIEDHVQCGEHFNWITQMEDLIDNQFIDMSKYLSVHGAYSLQCEICNCSIGATYRCVEQHIQGQRHMNTRTKKLMPWNGIFDVDGNEDMWCKLCDEYINNNCEDILEHIDSNEEHIRKIQELEECEDEGISIDDYLSYLNESKAFCSPCGKKVPCNPHNLEEHINGNGHNSA